MFAKEIKTLLNFIETVEEPSEKKKVTRKKKKTTDTPETQITSINTTL